MTGKSLKFLDPETGGGAEKLDDELAIDAECFVMGASSPTVRYVDATEIILRSAVPIYYDQEFDQAYEKFLRNSRFDGFQSLSPHAGFAAAYPRCAIDPAGATGILRGTRPCLDE